MMHEFYEICWKFLMKVYSRNDEKSQLIYFNWKEIESFIILSYPKVFVENEDITSSYFHFTNIIFPLNPPLYFILKPTKNSFFKKNNKIISKIKIQFRKIWRLKVFVCLFIYRISFCLHFARTLKLLFLPSSFSTSSTHPIFFKSVGLNQHTKCRKEALKVDFTSDPFSIVTSFFFILTFSEKEIHHVEIEIVRRRDLEM